MPVIVAVSGAEREVKDSMENLVLATRNKKKRAELEGLVDRNCWGILTLDDFPDCPDVVEDGETFIENARKKALAVSRFTDKLAVADDSGIAVDALDGAPGIYSARFARGEGSTDEDNNQALLKALENTPDEKRTARYVCAVVLAVEEDILFETEQTVEGQILREHRGQGGFGYDPLFYYPPFGATFAEVPIERKHTVSHRGKAMRELAAFLRKRRTE